MNLSAGYRMMVKVEKGSLSSTWLCYIIVGLHLKLMTGQADRRQLTVVGYGLLRVSS